MTQRGWNVTWTAKKKHITFTNGNGDKVRDTNISKTFSMNIDKENLIHEFERQNELRLAGATPTEIGKKMDSSSITEKSSQQSKESIMQSQSETIRRQAQEIRLLSSENLMMKKKLQEQSETIVALNGADKVLQENRMLEKQNSELRKRASEAEAAAEAVKTSYKEKMEKAKKKLARAEELEQEAQKKWTRRTSGSRTLPTGCHMKTLPASTGCIARTETGCTVNISSRNRNAKNGIKGGDRKTKLSHGESFCLRLSI